MRRVTVIADPAIALQAASSVALRTRPAGPVGLLVLGSSTSAQEESIKPIGRLPMPTPGAVRVAAQLRRAGHRATARWRLVICRPSGADQTDDAAAILEAACGCVTAVSEALMAEGDPPSLPACDLAVGVLPADAPVAALEEAEASLIKQGRSALVLELPDARFGGSLALAGICPPPEWATALDSLDRFLGDS